MSWYRTEISINLSADGQPTVFTLGQVFLVFLLLISIGTSYYFYDRYRSTQNKEEEAKMLVADVAKLMILPEELPTIATVTDPKALTGQPFFEKAEAGDRVLVFTDAKKAILYRPSIKKIVEVMPFATPENIQ